MEESSIFGVRIAPGEVQAHAMSPGSGPSRERVLPVRMSAGAEHLQAPIPRLAVICVGVAATCTAPALELGTIVQVLGEPILPAEHCLSPRTLIKLPTDVLRRLAAAEQRLRVEGLPGEVRVAPLMTQDGDLLRRLGRDGTGPLGLMTPSSAMWTADWFVPLPCLEMLDAGLLADVEAMQPRYTVAASIEGPIDRSFSPTLRSPGSIDGVLTARDFHGVAHERFLRGLSSPESPLSRPLSPDSSEYEVSYYASVLAETFPYGPPPTPSTASRHSPGSSALPVPLRVLDAASVLTVSPSLRRVVSLRGHVEMFPQLDFLAATGCAPYHAAVSSIPSPPCVGALEDHWATATLLSRRNSLQLEPRVSSGEPVDHAWYAWLCLQYQTLQTHLSPYSALYHPRSLAGGDDVPRGGRHGGSSAAICSRVEP